MSDRPLEEYSLPYLWSRITELEEEVTCLSNLVTSQEEGLFKYETQLEAVKGLLRIARCPNKNCDNDGTILLDYTHGDVEQCQWCYERDKAIGEGEDERRT